MKRIPIYVKRYVPKFFASEFEGKVLKLKNRVVAMSQDFHQAPKTMLKQGDQLPGHTLIYIECRFSSLHVLFAIKQNLERRFRDKMYNDVQLLMRIGYSRWNALITFYKMNSLIEEDYDFNSAYRLMQKMEKADPNSVKRLNKKQCKTVEI